MAKHKRRLGWSFDKPQNPLVDIDVSFLVTRETWNDVASKGQFSLLRLTIASNAIMSYKLKKALFQKTLMFWFFMAEKPSIIYTTEFSL